VSNNAVKPSPALLATLIVAVSASGSAQQATPGGRPLAFEAASVKPNTSGDWRKSLGPAPGGRFLAANNTLRDLIPFAYGIPQVTAGFRVVGGPKWIDEDRFDIVATVGGTWTPQQMSEMLRTLLRDRFRLAAHHETRDLPIYTLAALSGGHRLKRSSVDQAVCDARRAAIQRREPVPPSPPGAPPACGTGRSNPGMITAVGWSLDALTSALSPFVSRVVVDRTGLTGLFDFELKWTPDAIPQLPADAPPLNVDPNGPSIFTALQEQLGLRLESARGPVDVVVIDRVEHPTPD
jgi:bla regulator protein blaR1